VVSGDATAPSRLASQDVPGERGSHGAQPEEAYVCHGDILFILLTGVQSIGYLRV